MFRKARPFFFRLLQTLQGVTGLFSPEAYHQMFMLQIKEQIHILNANNTL